MSTGQIANVWGEAGGEPIELPYIKKTGDTATGKIIFDGGLETNIGTATFNGPVIFTNEVTFTDVSTLIIDGSVEFTGPSTKITGGYFEVDVPSTFNDTVDINEGLTLSNGLAVDNSDVLFENTCEITIECQTTLTDANLIIDGTSAIVFPDATQQVSAYTGAGALAGSYTNVNMTVNNQGRITALSNASSAFLPGFIQMYSVINTGSNQPAGWLWCNGSQYLQTDYPALYAAIGLTYSNPIFTPPGYFLVPAFEGRVPFGNSYTGTIGLSYTAGGVPTTSFQGGSLTIDSNSLPNHTHGITWSSYTYAHNLSSHSYGSVGGTEPTVSTGQQSNLPTSTDVNSSQLNSYIQPFTTVNYIIKY